MSNQAWAVEVDGRFFCGVGKKRQVNTAWHLAGAKLFQSRYDAEQVEGFVSVVRRRAKVQVVSVSAKVAL